MSREISPTVETADNGREKNGKFGKGNNFATGNPYTKRVAHLRKLISDSIRDDDMKAIILKLVENAKQGDIASAKLLLSYAIGLPQSYENPDLTFPGPITDLLVHKLKNETDDELADELLGRPSLENRVLIAGQKFSAILTSPST